MNDKILGTLKSNPQTRYIGSQSTIQPHQLEHT